MKQQGPIFKNGVVKNWLFPLSIIGLMMCSNCSDPIDIQTKRNPCAGKSVYTGDFYILENVGDSLVQTDTVLRYNYITFRASDSYYSYEWNIGDDPRVHTKKEVTLLFMEAEGEIKVTLKSKNKDNCFPDAPNDTTVIRSIYIVEWQNAPIIGKYIGYFENTPTIEDSIEIKLSGEKIDLININQGCQVNPEFPDFPVWTGLNVGATAISFNANGVFYNGCKSPQVWLYLTSKDSIHAFFTYLDDQNQQQPYPIISDTFSGLRSMK